MRASSSRERIRLTLEYSTFTGSLTAFFGARGRTLGIVLDRGNTLHVLQNDPTKIVSIDIPLFADGPDRWETDNLRALLGDEVLEVLRAASDQLPVVQPLTGETPRPQVIEALKQGLVKLTEQEVGLPDAAVLSARRLAYEQALGPPRSNAHTIETRARRLARLTARALSTPLRRLGVEPLFLLFLLVVLAGARVLAPRLGTSALFLLGGAFAVLVNIRRAPHARSETRAAWSLAYVSIPIAFALGQGFAAPRPVMLNVLQATRESAASLTELQLPVERSLTFLPAASRVALRTVGGAGDADCRATRQIIPPTPAAPAQAALDQQREDVIAQGGGSLVQAMHDSDFKRQLMSLASRDTVFMIMDRPDLDCELVGGAAEVTKGLKQLRDVLGGTPLVMVSMGVLSPGECAVLERYHAVAGARVYNERDLEKVVHLARGVAGYGLTYMEKERLVPKPLRCLRSA